MASDIALSDPRAANPGLPPTETERSLFGEILDWMLAPLLFVWPLSIAFTHYFANNVANYPYDQSLREHVAAISRQVKLVNGKAVVSLPSSTRAVLRSDELDSVYFHVLTHDRRLLAGDKELPPPDTLPGNDLVPGDIYFRDLDYKGQDIRVAYSYLAESAMAPKDWVLVEVGETTEKRTQLANKIVASVILPQFVIIPLAVMLVWFGLSRGLRPLTRLRNTIEARDRLKAMAETNDGFEIARRDLDIRGPGEFLGARQSGAAMLRFADLATDSHLLEWARDWAPQLLQRWPELAQRHIDRWLGSKSDYLKA